jgi:hypothetical protein
MIVIGKGRVGTEIGSDTFDGPLKNVMYVLLGVHLVQFVFLRNLYDENRNVTTRHVWVWILHLVVYPVVMVIYSMKQAEE